MSEMAKKFIGLQAQAAATRAQTGGGVTTYWPASEGIEYADAVTYLDLYHDLVTNKGYQLPNTRDNIKALADAIRKTLGITKGSKKFLHPTLTIMKITETGTDVNPELYNWLFPKRMEAETEKPWYDPLIPGDQTGTGGGITGAITDIKWIAFFGLAALVILQTGILKKVSPNA